MPIPRMSPVMVMMLSVSPMSDMPSKVTRMEMGMERPMMIVPFMLRKKRRMMSMARNPPWKAELYTSPMVAEIMVVSSLRMVRLTPRGSIELISGRPSRTERATVVLFESVSLDTEMYNPGTPSM